VTHSFNADQSYVPLSFSVTGGGLTVQAPADADLAPPGYYMLFIVNKNGVPSVAPFVQLPVPSADVTPPSAPTNLAAAVSGSTAALTWTASTDNVGVVRYDVYRSTTSGFTPSAANKVGQSTTAGYTDSGLAAGVYYYRVIAADAAGNASTASNEAGATVTAAPIRMIQHAANGFESSTSSLSLAFPSAVTAGDFLIVTGTAARPSSTLTISDSAGDVFVPAIGPVTDPNQDVTAYVWYVVNAKGGADTVTITPNNGADALEIHVSEWSGISSTSPVDQTSSATGRGTAISSGSKTTTQNGELIFGYTFPNQNSTAGAGFTGLSLINGDLDEYQIQGAAGSVAATFTQASDYWLALMVTFDPAATTPDTQPPTAPGAPTATGSPGAVSLGWVASTDNVGVTGYNVYRSTTSGFTPSAAALIGASATNSYVDTVAPGTYFYRVTAQDAAGNVSAPSPEVAGTSSPPDTTPPTAPTNVTATSAIGSVSLSWTASTDDVGVVRYNVYRSTTSGFTPSSGNLIGTSVTASYTDSVTAGSYYYLITALDAAGNVSPP
jgi:fibronectin type 3 domain-containing protein